MAFPVISCSTDCEIACGIITGSNCLPAGPYCATCCSAKARARCWTSCVVMSCPATFATTPWAGWPSRSEPRPPGIRVITMPPQMISSSVLSTIFLVGPGVCRKRIMFELSLQRSQWGVKLDYKLGAWPDLAAPVGCPLRGSAWLGRFLVLRWTVEILVLKRINKTCYPFLRPVSLALGRSSFHVPGTFRESPLPRFGVGFALESLRPGPASPARGRRRTKPAAPRRGLGPASFEQGRCHRRSAVQAGLLDTRLALDLGPHHRRGGAGQ